MALKKRGDRFSVVAAFAVMRAVLPLLALLYLTFDGVERQIDSLFECFRALLGYYVAARNMQRRHCDLVAVFVVFVQTQNDVHSCRTVCETLQTRHFFLYEFYQLLAGIEFH